jgi:hypothetical protein
MSYSPAWTNANYQGRLTPGAHWAKLCDLQELAVAVNRRRLLAYQDQQDYSSVICEGAYVRRPPLAVAVQPPFDNFRAALIDDILRPQPGGLGGEPPSPSSMDWLWPVPGGDENKVIVASNPQAGQVALFDKLNGGSDWTDATLTAGVSFLRAVHHNELRQAIEWISRGRWKTPIYFCGGIFSILPDAPWLSEAVANNGSDEVRNVGFAQIYCGDPEVMGLTNATARGGSFVQLTVNHACTVELYRCHRPVRFVEWPPTWNEYDPGESLAWASPGGLGSADATYIGSAALAAGLPGTISGQGLTAALQAIVDGAQPNFLIRRSDTGDETVLITSASVTVEFDLDAPPN